MHIVKPIRLYVGLAARHPWILLASYAALTALAAWPASRLTLVTALGALLPRDTTSVQALDESNRRIGSTDMFTIAINAEDPADIARFQDDAARIIESGDPAHGIDPWDDASWVQTAKPTDFFAEHALYYIPRSDLEDLRDRLEKNFQFQAARVGGFSLLDEEDDERARKELMDWFDPELPTRLGMPDQVGDKLRSYFEKQSDPPPDSATTTTLPPGLRDRLISPDGKQGVVLVRLARPSTDIDYARMALERGTLLVDTLDPGSYSPEMTAQVVGGYRSFMEVKAIGDDAKLATALSLGLVLVFFIAFFRRARAVVFVIVPLVMGCVLMLGLTGLTYQRLTSITAFVVAMLIGMGIDYGIHLYTRAVAEFQAGRSWQDALGLAIQSTGRGLLAAALTTIASLLTLLAAHFKGFFEYGIIASYGIAFCLLMSVLALPPLVFAFEKIRPTKYARTTSTSPPHTILGRPAWQVVVVFLALATVASALILPHIPGVQFEHDFRRLRGAKTKHTVRYGAAIGKDRGTTANLVLGESEAEMRVIHEELLRRKLDEKDERLRSFVTIATFLPTGAQQASRKEVIDEIAEICDRKAMRKIKDPDTKKMVEELREMAHAEPFEAEDLPRWVVEMFTETDGSVGHIGYIWTRIEKWDAHQVMAFQDDYGLLPAQDRQVPVSSSDFILADVVRTVKHDAQRLAIWIAVVIFAILIVDLRSIRGLVACALALALGAAWTAGLMGWIDIRLGLYNIIVIPTVLGVAIDGSIHLVHRLKELGPKGFGTALKVTGRGVLAASLTTAAGFTGLLFIQHKGLKTIGTMAVTGVLATMVAVLLVTPALFWLIDRIIPRKKTARKETEKPDPEDETPD